MKSSREVPSWFAPLALLVALLAGPVAALADGGTVVQLNGSATIESKGNTLQASVGSRLESGDTLVTGKNAKAQLRLDDDSVFAVVGDSSFKMDQFQLRRQDQGGNAIFSLLRGGFRTITGLIGKIKNDKYEIRTGVATIGVRGSAYSAVLCKGQCGPKFKDGLYVKAEKGIIIVSNSHGKIELRVGQIAYVESEFSAPFKVKVSPFNDAVFAADYTLSIEFELEVDPPRIEQEPPASPS